MRPLETSIMLIVSICWREKVLLTQGPSDTLQLMTGLQACGSWMLVCGRNRAEMFGQSCPPLPKKSEIAKFPPINLYDDKNLHQITSKLC